VVFVKLALVADAIYGFLADNTGVTILFSEYIASAGPGIPITQNRKNCQLAAWNSVVAVVWDVRSRS
jgi:hypothetical protein